MFEITGVRQAKSQKSIPTDESGIPYVVQSQSNNMVSRFVNKEYLTIHDEPVCEGNAIVLGVTLPAVSYQENEFGASQVITARANFLTRDIGLYFVSVLEKQTARFSYTNKPGIQIYKDMTISLPIVPGTDNQIDFNYMERYVKAMEKVVIADVVRYKDRIIEETKKIIN